MKHILIPTNLSIESLGVVNAVALAQKESKIKIILFHLLSPSSDISELLFRRNRHYNLISADFSEACEILLNRYSSIISSIHIKFGFGDTVAYLRNYLEGERIDEIAICKDIMLSMPSKRSMNAIPLLEKTRWPVQHFKSDDIKQIWTGMNTAGKTLSSEIKVPQKAKKYVTQNQYSL